MQLVNKTCLKGVPGLYQQDNKGDQAIVYLKFFMESWTWMLTELDQQNGQAFGIVYSSMCPEGELGYFSLMELSQLRGSVGQGVERDRYWDRKPLCEVKNPCNS